MGSVFLSVTKIFFSNLRPPNSVTLIKLRLTLYVCVRENVRLTTQSKLT